MQFEAGNEVLAILGASGCGKSMTLKCIAGIEKPDRGRIVLNDVVLFDSEKHINLKPQKRRAGYLFQQYALFPNMTVLQNVVCGVREGSRSEKEERALGMLDRLHLSGQEFKKPSQLSGGQQQRCALARILVNDPEVLLLDEPFSALDAHLRFHTERQVENLIHSFGKPVVFVSHDRDEVFRLTDNIAVMENGKFYSFGEKHEVFLNPTTIGGALLTGCKNISEAYEVAPGRVFAKDWGVELSVPEVPDDLAAVGIRIHDVRFIELNPEYTPEGFGEEDSAYEDGADEKLNSATGSGEAEVLQSAYAPDVFEEADSVYEDEADGELNSTNGSGGTEELQSTCEQDVFDEADSVYETGADEELNSANESDGSENVQFAYKPDVFEKADSVYEAGADEELNSANGSGGTEELQSAAGTDNALEAESDSMDEQDSAYASDADEEATTAQESGFADEAPSEERAGNANIFLCEVIGEIENPFSYSVMLQPDSSECERYILLDLEKKFWDNNRTDYLTVQLPSDKLLMLK